MSRPLLVEGLHRRGSATRLRTALALLLIENSVMPDIRTSQVDRAASASIRPAPRMNANMVGTLLTLKTTVRATALRSRHGRGRPR